MFGGEEKKTDKKERNSHNNTKTTRHTFQASQVGRFFHARAHTPRHFVSLFHYFFSPDETRGPSRTKNKWTESGSRFRRHSESLVVPRRSFAQPSLSSVAKSPDSGIPYGMARCPPSHGGETYFCPSMSLNRATVSIFFSPPDRSFPLLLPHLPPQILRALFARDRSFDHKEQQGISQNCRVHTVHQHFFTRSLVVSTMDDFGENRDKEKARGTQAT